jgi:hypothetical protein
VLTEGSHLFKVAAASSNPSISELERRYLLGLSHLTATELLLKSKAEFLGNRFPDMKERQVADGMVT